MLVFDVRADRPALFAEQPQHFLDRRVARAPRHVVALVLLAILQVQVRDAVVMVADVLHGVEVRGREVADIEVDLEVLRHLHRLGKTLGRRELAGLRRVRVPVHRDSDLVFLGERRDALRDLDRGRRRDDVGPERFGLFEAAVDFRVSETGVRTVVPRVDDDASGLEFVPHRAEVIERRLDPPLAQLVSRGSRLDHRRPDFTFADTAGLHRVDHRVDLVATFRARQRAETVRLHADADAGDARVDAGSGQRAWNRERCKREFRELATSDHGYLGNANAYNVSPAPTTTYWRPSSM